MANILSVKDSDRSLTSSIESLSRFFDYNTNQWDDDVSNSYYSYVKSLSSNVFIFNNIASSIENINNSLDNFDEEKLYSRVNDFEGMVSKL